MQVMQGDATSLCITSGSRVVWWCTPPVHHHHHCLRRLLGGCGRNAKEGHRRASPKPVHHPVHHPKGEI